MGGLAATARYGVGREGCMRVCRDLNPKSTSHLSCTISPPSPFVTEHITRWTGSTNSVWLEAKLWQCHTIIMLVTDVGQHVPLVRRMFLLCVAYQLVVNILWQRPRKDFLWIAQKVLHNFLSCRLAEAWVVQSEWVVACLDYNCEVQAVQTALDRSSSLKKEDILVCDELTAFRLVAH